MEITINLSIVAIWFVAGTTKLHIRVATLKKANAGIFASIGSLPLHATTNVRVEALGREVFLFLNNSFDSMASLSADRIFGAATLFVSNPWQPPALATVGSIQMKSLSALTVTAASVFNGRLSKFAVYEKTTVPANFALSFKITPFEISSEWSSIIHYSKDKTNMGAGGRMPGMFFLQYNKLIECSNLVNSRNHKIKCASCYFKQCECWNIC